MPSEVPSGLYACTVHFFYAQVERDAQGEARQHILMSEADQDSSSPSGHFTGLGLAMIALVLAAFAAALAWVAFPNIDMRGGVRLAVLAAAVLGVVAALLWSAFRFPPFSSSLRPFGADPRGGDPPSGPEADITEADALSGWQRFAVASALLAFATACACAASPNVRMHLENVAPSLARGGTWVVVVGLAAAGVASALIWLTITFYPLSSRPPAGYERFDEIAPAFQSIVTGSCTVPTADGGTYTFQTDALTANGFDQRSCVIAADGNGLLAPGGVDSGCAIVADLPQYSWTNPFNASSWPAVAGVKHEHVRGIRQCTVSFSPSATAGDLAAHDQAIDARGAALTSGALQLQSLLNLTTLTLHSTSDALGTTASSLSQTTGTLTQTAGALSTAEADLTSASAKYVAFQAKSAQHLINANKSYSTQLSDANTQFSTLLTTEQAEMDAANATAQANAASLNSQLAAAQASGATNQQVQTAQSQLAAWTAASAVTTATLYAVAGFGGATWTPGVNAAYYQSSIQGAFTSVSVPAGQTFVGFSQDKLAGAPWTVVGPGIAPTPPASWGSSSVASCQVTATGTVTVFFDCDFRSTASTLAPGTYATPASTGLQDKSMSSVLVSPGCEITLYDQANNKGNSVLISASVTCFTSLSAGLPSGSWNDAASSCVVVSTYASPALGLTPPQPPPPPPPPVTLAAPQPCPKSDSWCTHSVNGVKAKLVAADCNGNGMVDWVCTDDSGNQGTIRRANTCASDWPKAQPSTCPNYLPALPPPPVPPPPAPPPATTVLFLGWAQGRVAGVDAQGQPTINGKAASQVDASMTHDKIANGPGNYWLPAVNTPYRDLSIRDDKTNGQYNDLTAYCWVPQGQFLRGFQNPGFSGGLWSVSGGAGGTNSVPPSYWWNNGLSSFIVYSIDKLPSSTTLYHNFDMTGGKWTPSVNKNYNNFYSTAGNPPDTDVTFNDTNNNGGANSGTMSVWVPPGQTFMGYQNSLHNGWQWYVNGGTLGVISDLPEGWWGNGLSSFVISDRSLSQDAMSRL